MEQSHPHRFKVKFSERDPERDPEECVCHHPCTVLQAIKASGIQIDYYDDFIIIHRGNGENESIIATHFPCSCIEDGELLTVSCQSESVEKIQSVRNREIYTKDKYSIFYISTKGGKDTKTKNLFKSKAVAKEPLKYLCVYGKKEITVAEALKRDGRFIDDLGNFVLSENNNSMTNSEIVMNLDNRKFQICLPRKKKTTRPQQKVEKAIPKGKCSVDTNIYVALNLSKENFGKIQESFSEVYRVEKLLKLAKSVCQIKVTNVCMGTGFVLFDSFILTSARLFQGYVSETKGKQKELQKEVLAIFDCQESEHETKFHCFNAENTLIDFDADLDYAVLSFKNPNPENQDLPPGLLSEFGPLPDNGKACIIGHPAGGVKKMDPTFIIEIEKRDEAANEKSRGSFIIKSISDYMSKKGTENILEYKKTEITFMYHGTAGSPVFNDVGKVFGLHTGGFTYGFTKEVEGVIGYGFSLFIILENFVNNLMKSGNNKLLKCMKEAAQGNESLKEVLNTA